MKALIISDTHHNYNDTYKVLSSENDVDMIIHAGDVLDDVVRLERENPKYDFRFVIGNNDYSGKIPTEIFFNIEGFKVFLTHGHKYGVKQGLHRLLLRAKELSADVSIFGHTHINYLENVDGIWLVNPGTVWNHTYAVLEVKGGLLDIELRQV